MEASGFGSEQFSKQEGFEASGFGSKVSGFGSEHISKRKDFEVSGFGSV